MTPAMFVIEMIVLVIGGAVYGIARTAPEVRAKRQAGTFEAPLPPLFTDTLALLAILGLILVPCALIGVVLWAIMHYDLSQSDGLVAAGIAVPVVSFAAIRTGIGLRLDERFARGRLVIDKEGLSWEYGSARGRISFEEPFVLRRTLAMEPHGRLLYQVCTVGQKEKTTRFFYLAGIGQSKFLVWRWIDGTDGIFLGQHGTEIINRLKARAESFEETPPGK